MLSMIDKSNINKDLILREKLALQRTVLANQTTLLAFLRSSMYFLVAGLSIKTVLLIENGLILQVVLFLVSAILLIYGVFNYFHHKKKISSSEIHIGSYKDEYEA
jgi:putative membrane protein